MSSTVGTSASVGEWSSPHESHQVVANRPTDLGRGLAGAYGWGWSVKVRFYCDLYLPLNPQFGLHAMTNPGEKVGGKRFAFDVVIPDTLLYGTDATAPEPAKVELIRPVGDDQ